MKHTPGPWNFDGHGINHDGERIAKVCHSIPYIYPEGKPIRNERFDADSRLIAAAPEMLEALKLVMYEVDNKDARLRPHIGMKISAAIARAEGR